MVGAEARNINIFVPELQQRTLLDDLAQAREERAEGGGASKVVLDVGVKHRPEVGELLVRDDGRDDVHEGPEDELGVLRNPV